MDTITPSWRLMAARGAVALLFGVVAFLWPTLTLSALAMAFGAYTLMDGLLILGLAARTHSAPSTWTFALEGLLGIALGLVAMIWTRGAITLVVYAVGFWAIATGLLELSAARAIRTLGGRAGMMRVGGFLSLVLGVVVILAPSVSAMVFMLVLALYALTFGAALLAHAIDIRKHEQRSRSGSIESHA